MSILTAFILRAARDLLPPHLRRWGEAAAREAETAEGPGAQLGFAIGCLIWAAREAVVFHLSPFQQEDAPMTNLVDFLRGPRGVALLCALTATSLGLLYMAMGGAPARYLMINAGALAFGLIGLAGLALADRRGHLRPAAISLILGVAVLAVGLWGVSAEGVSRWVSLGALALQPSLIVLPLMLSLFARSRDPLSAAGLAVAAVGLALQPDRAMAGAMTAGLAMLAFTRPNRSVLAALAASIAGFAVTLVRPDPSPAMPFVDGILYSAFGVSPLAGAAVLAGSALLIAPSLLTSRPDPAMATFGAGWSAIVLAAALGNYPTPLVGYGGSAVIGYLLSLIVFPRHAVADAGRAAVGAREEVGPPDRPALYTS